MKNQRYDMFNAIHKALRGLFYETALCLQQTDFSLTEEAHLAAEKVKEVLEILDSHARHEDQFLLPLIHRIDPETAASFESDHHTDEKLTRELEKAISRLQNAITGETALEAGKELHHLFIGFVAFNLTHMNREEKLLNQILWDNFSDEDLQRVEGELIASIPEDEMAYTTVLMIKGINNMELTGLLMEAKQAMPEEAFNHLLETTEEVIGPVRWIKIREVLNEGEVLI